MKNRAVDTNVVLTIGHSTRTVAAFIPLLKENRVARVIDIRTVPRSRHNPQFNTGSQYPMPWGHRVLATGI